MTEAGATCTPKAPVADARFDAMRSVIEQTVALRHLLLDGSTPVAETYVEGAVGALLHARDALRNAALTEKRLCWRVRLVETGILQGGDTGARLSTTLEDGGFRSSPRPDVGADLIRSERIAGLVEADGFAALLTSALAEHRWLHLSSGATWCGTWAAAEALVRALGSGRVVTMVDHRVMRGTVDAAVARELASLGWRRISSPALPGLD